MSLMSTVREAEVPLQMENGPLGKGGDERGRGERFLGSGSAQETLRRRDSALIAV